MNKTWDGKRCDMCGGHRGNDRKESLFCKKCAELLAKHIGLWKQGKTNVRV